MSTRASVVVKDDTHQLFFYQHSDGYPDGLGKTLQEFLETAEAKRRRGDAEYFAGVMLGRVNEGFAKGEYDLPDLVPAVGVHGDESYQYIIDCDKLTLETKEL